MKLFDYVNAINAGNDEVNKSEEPEETIREYNPFIINKAFSFYQDSILAANAMNVCNNTDKKLQFDFYINILRSRKRYSKWFKREKNEDLEAVAEYFSYNYQKAKEALYILTADDIKIIKQKLQKGGRR
jgi:hypothetical protein